MLNTMFSVFKGKPDNLNHENKTPSALTDYRHVIYVGLFTLLLFLFLKVHSVDHPTSALPRVMGEKPLSPP